MVIRKPYKFLIKNFKKIHLFLSFILMYVCYKSSVLLNYFNKLIEGTASRNLSLNYIDNFIIFLIIFSLIGFIIIYILMRHKNKPKLIYFISILGYIVVIVFLLLSYSYLKVIRLEYIVQKTIRLYRDLVQIGLYFQYFICLCMLIRGLGFDIKKFDFSKDLQEFSIDDNDNEEVEVDITLDYNKLDRSVNRTKRELKYYFYENKLFILIIIGVLFMIGLVFILNYNFNINKTYKQNELIKIGNYEFSIEDTYITNKNYLNNNISNNQYVVVKFKMKSNSDKYSNYNINNFKIKYKGDIYNVDTKLCKYFSDVGNCYKEQSINNNFNSYILVFGLNNNKINRNVIFELRYGEKIHQFKLQTKETFNKEYKLNETIDLSNTNLKDNQYKIISYNISNRFDYTYQNCLSTGECINHNSSVSSQVGLIMQLNVESKILGNNFGLNNATFIEYYGTLKYTKEGKEYTSLMNNKTSSKVNDKVYLEVDKDIQNADSIWIDFNIRGNKIKYVLK